jgi:hypothetical protein
MSCRVYEKYQLPTVFAGNQFEHVEYGLSLQAMVVLNRAQTILFAPGFEKAGDVSFASIVRGKLRELEGIGGRDLPVNEMSMIRFKQSIEELAQNPKAVVAVTLAFVKDGKCETFSTFVTRTSQQMHQGLLKDVDLGKFMKKTKGRMQSKYSHCAYCLATRIPGECQECDVDCPNPCCDREPWFCKLKSCGGCESVFYCSEECQKKDWHRGHKLACSVFYWMSPHFYPQEDSDETFRNDIIETFVKIVEPTLARFLNLKEESKE